MSPKTRRNCVLAYRIVVVLLAFFLAVTAAAAQAKKFPITPDQQLWLAAAVAAMSGLDALRAAILTWRAPGREGARSRAQKAVVSALVNIARDTKVDLQHIGASVFHIRRRGWRRRKRLVRVLRFRLDDHPPPSPVVWTEGKGLIGYCWKTNKPQRKDRAECARQQKQANVSEAGFRSLSAKLRTCFTHSEYVNIVDKYGEILAVPIGDAEGKIIGVLSIDIAKKAPLTQDVLHPVAVTEYATSAAEILRDDLRTLYDQV